MDDQEALRLAEANYLGSWRLLAERAVGGEVDEDDDVLLVAVPVPVAVFNSAFVKPHASPVDHLERIRDFYEQRARPFTVHHRGERPSLSGLEPGDVSPVMVAETAGVAAAAAAGAEVVAVDAGRWDDHVRTVAGGFEAPADLIARVLPPGLPADGAYSAFLAYDGDVPVATAAMVVAAGVAGVYNVATPAPHRRRGWGEAVTRAAVVEGARRGCALATLQSSAAGYAIYERLGFRTLATWQAHTSPS